MGFADSGLHDRRCTSSLDWSENFLPQFGHGTIAALRASSASSCDRGGWRVVLCSGGSLACSIALFFAHCAWWIARLAVPNSLPQMKHSSIFGGTAEEARDFVPPLTFRLGSAQTSQT